MNKLKTRRNGISLRLSLSSAFVITVVVTTIVLGICTFISVRNFVRSEIQQRLATAVGIAAIQIEADKHATLKTKDDEKGQVYVDYQQKLRRIRDSSKDIRYVYTFRKQADGKIVFVVDAEEPSDKFSHIGDPYDSPTSVLLESFKPPYQVRVESEFSKDDWGIWLSAFAPVLDRNGNLEALVGMDIAAEKAFEYERNYLLVILGIALPLVSIVAFVGLLFSRKISGPIHDLALELQKIQELDLDGKHTVASKIQEITEIGDAVSDMKRGLRSFSRYVPTEVVRNLMELKKEAEIGADKREMSFFFSDLANFTKICEQWPQEVIAEHLDEYFECISRTIMNTGHGTVDKFVGDTVMAFWGAPKANSEHAKFACKAALSCQLQLEKLVSGWNSYGVSGIHTRIGISTGSALVGNFGFNERLSYTAIGDTVNLASRLESLNKIYGTKILVSEDTWKVVHKDFEWRQIDSIVVRGRTNACRIFEVVGEKGQVSDEKVRILNIFNEAMFLYLERKWSDASRLLSEFLKNHPEDKATRVILERCLKFQAEPPPADWLGATVMLEK
jgi:adenylate cyclase